jgi:hypothetical protein
MKSWKTTICAVGCIGIAVLFKMKYIDMESTLAAIAIAAAMGFGVSKDYNVSGSNKPPGEPKP